MSESSGNQRQFGFPSEKINITVSSIKVRSSLPIRSIVLGVVCAVVFALIISSNLPEEAINIEEIDKEIVADKELRASFSFQTEDIKATNEARNLARAKVPPHFRFDQEIIDRQKARLKDRLEALRKIRNEIIKEFYDRELKSQEEGIRKISDFIRARFIEIFPTLQWDTSLHAEDLLVWVLPDLNGVFKNRIDLEQSEPSLSYESISGNSFGDLKLTFLLSEQLASIAHNSLMQILSSGVILDRKELENDKIVIVRDNPAGDQKTTEEVRGEEIPDVREAVEVKLRLHIEKEIKRLVEQTASISLDTSLLINGVYALTRDLVVSTLRYDPITTEIVRERAADSIVPVMKEIAAGEIIQERGKRWTLESRSDAKTYLELLKKSQGLTPFWLYSFLANFILVSLSLVGLHRAIRIWEHKGEPDEETMWNLALLLIFGILLLARGMYLFDHTGFSVPVAIVGILYAILVQMRLSAFLSFVACVLVSVLFRYDWRLLIYNVAMCMGSVFVIYRVRKRRDITSSSLTGIVVGFITLVAITLTTENLLSEASFRRFSLLGINGSLCLLIVPGILPFLERWFGIVTDFQLLEYTDLNNEILKQMAVEAPATYSHSMILGQIAESAADAIGANGLLARVCAYYHDIGKMVRSEYFCENQNGHNIHDQLSPRYSARIIRSHVTEGIQLAQQYKLPKPIIDAIAQHHGTFRIGYFYRLAQEQESNGNVDESEFRYPGPKPQRPEYAIVMICDAAESAIRSLRNPTPEQIRQVVERIVIERANDGQFDECDLTLKQLNIITEEVSRALTALLHVRVSYGQTEDKSMLTDSVIQKIYDKESENLYSLKGVSGKQ